MWVLGFDKRLFLFEPEWNAVIKFHGLRDEEPPKLWSVHSTMCLGSFAVYRMLSLWSPLDTQLALRSNLTRVGHCGG